MKRRRAVRPTAVSRGALLMQAVFAVLLTSIVASGLTLVSSAQEMRELYRRMGEVQRERDSLSAEYSRLLLERSAISSLQNIETAAQNELDMQFPDGIGEVLE